MTNSIRTPRQGKTAGSRRIAQAVDNEDWQKFRLSMKGQSTQTKLDMLRAYYEEQSHPIQIDIADCDACIRVDNYIKALCRGGQLYAGESLASILRANWNVQIKK